MHDPKFNLMSSEGETTSGRGPVIEKFEPIRCQGYCAYISRDTRLYPPVYHYVIVKDGSNDILAWQQARSLDEARSAAVTDMEDLARMSDGD